MKEPFHALNIDKGKALGHFIRKMHAVHGINKAFVQEIVEIALPTVSVVAFIVIGIPVVIDALRSNADILAIALFAFEEFVRTVLGPQYHDYLFVSVQRR